MSDACSYFNRTGGGTHLAAREDLYLLRRGVTEQLITEGFERVRGAHSATAIGDDTLKGLLGDQEATRAVQIGNRILDGRHRMHHANGDYHPPFPEEPTDLDRF